MIFVFLFLSYFTLYDRQLPYDPTIPLLGIYPEKTIIQNNVHCSTIYNIQDMEAT